MDKNNNVQGALPAMHERREGIMNRYNVWNPDVQDACSWYCFAENAKDAARQYIAATRHKGRLCVRIMPKIYYFNTEELGGE